MFTEVLIQNPLTSLLVAACAVFIVLWLILMDRQIKTPEYYWVNQWITRIDHAIKHTRKNYPRAEQSTQLKYRFAGLINDLVRETGSVDQLNFMEWHHKTVWIHLIERHKQYVK